MLEKSFTWFIKMAGGSNGWKWHCHKTMMPVISNVLPLPRPVGEYLLALLLEERESLLSQLVSDHFIASRTQISSTKMWRCFHHAGLYACKTTSLYSTEPTTEKCPFMLSKREHVSKTTHQWAFLLSKFTLECDSRYLLTWR